MDLSPNDIRNYEFNTQMRGFDKEEVESFLEQVATTLEDLKQDLLKKTIEMDSLQKRYDELKEHEETIKSAAIDARRNADLTIKNAKQEAEQLLSDAKIKAENLIHDKAHEFKKIEVQISNLEDTKKSYLTELKKLIESHLTLVDEVAEAELEIPEVATGELEVTDSTDITVNKMETIANKMSQDDSQQVKPVEDSSEDIEGKSIPKQEVVDQTNDSVDSELEAALKNYQKDIDNSSQDTPPPPPQPAPPPSPEQPMFGPERVVETTARAEDIPEGFIAGNQDQISNSNDTDKVETVSNNAPEKKNPNDTNPLKPEELADELDNVAAKFEEVVDEAVKSK